MREILIGTNVFVENHLLGETLLHQLVIEAGDVHIVVEHSSESQSASVWYAQRENYGFDVITVKDFESLWHLATFDQPHVVENPSEFMSAMLVTLLVFATLFSPTLGLLLTGENYES